MAIKHRLAHFNGKPLAYNFDTLEDCLKIPSREGLFIIEYDDSNPEDWKITHHGSKDLGWTPHTLAITTKSDEQATERKVSSVQEIEPEPQVQADLNAPAVALNEKDTNK